MRLLMFGAYAHGGFGVVTESLAVGFLERGLDVRVIATDHRGQPVRGPLAGRVWPAAIYGDSHGGNISAQAITGQFWRDLEPDDEWAPEVILSVNDVSGLLGNIGKLTNPKSQAAWASVPVFHYCPIEGDNLPPSWAPIWGLVRPVAMSDYGAALIGSLVGHPVPRIYHGVDTETFHPVSPSNPIVFEGKTLVTREACKAALGADPRRNLIVRSDKLVERKFYDRFLAAMVLVLERSPDTDVLIHCSPEDRGLNLFAELDRLPEWTKGRIGLTGRHDSWVGLPVEGMAALMNAADLYVSTTGGEGFGLNLAEAMACATPVVATDWAADREVIGPGGVVIPPLTDSYGEPVRYHSQYGMDWAVPDPKAFVEPILTLLAKPARRRAMGAEGRAHVQRSFSWDTACAEFVGLFEEANARPAVAS